jgi:hypothetical protein
MSRGLADHMPTFDSVRTFASRFVQANWTGFAASLAVGLCKFFENVPHRRWHGLNDRSLKALTQPGGSIA